MRRLLHSSAEGIVYALALGAGLWLSGQLHDSTSPLRLRAAELADQVKDRFSKGVTP